MISDIPAGDGKTANSFLQCLILPDIVQGFVIVTKITYKKGDTVKMT